MAQLLANEDWLASMSRSFDAIKLLRKANPSGNAESRNGLRETENAGA